MGIFEWLFEADLWPARRVCGEWPAWLVWSEVIFNSVTTLSYFVISAVLLWFWNKNRDETTFSLDFVFVSFILFVFLCGLSHLFGEVLVFFWPAYRLIAVIHALTAISSAVCAVAFPFCIYVLTKKNLRILRQISMLMGSYYRSAIGMAFVSPDGRWLEVNDRLCEMLGYSREELVKMTFQEITTEDTLANDLYKLDSVIRGDTSYYECDKAYLHKDGHRVEVNLFVSSVLVHGECVGFVSQIVDITGYLMTHARSESQVRQLRQMSHVTAHELQEPIRQCRMFCEYLQQDEAENLSERGLEYFSRMVKAMDRLDARVRDLLSYSTIGEIAAKNHFEELDLGQVVDFFRSDNALPRINVVGDLGKAFGSRNTIVQVFENILTNAQKYAKTAVEVTRIDDPKNEVHIVMRDFGPGVEERHLKLIFEPFKRIHSTVHGTGMGLPIVKAICEAHNGTAWAELKDPGLEFHLVFNGRRHAAGKSFIR
jgi:PAS domain S-box-containing protein